MAGECEVQMGPANMPCADGQISWATAGGGDEEGSYHAGSGGGIRRVK